MGKNRIKLCFLELGLLMMATGLFAERGEASVSSKKTEKLGTSYQLNIKDAKYSSSDTTIAYVDSDGMVTAKKIGKTVISIKKNGAVYKQHLTVVANGKMKRKVNVSTGEISILENKLILAGTVKKKAESEPEPETTPDVSASATPEAENDTVTFSVRAKIKNGGKYQSGKVYVYGKIGKNTYKINCGSFKAQETKTVTLTKTVKKSDFYSEPTAMEMKKLIVYSNKMYTQYNFATKKTTFHYGTKDTKAPVISGFTGKNSYNQKMPYMVVYADDKDYDFFQYVKAEDDRDTKVDFWVSTKKVNYKKAGTYKITYYAEDRAGNRAKAVARIEIRKKKTVDEYADEVLKEITKPEWSVFKKAKAIYKYTRNHISYVGYSNKSSWEKEAIQGLRYGKGDCFTYYSVARALLTRAGIPNIEVTRYKGAGHHWWNMIYVKGGWYHYDCGPRKAGGTFCMVTDAQLTQYSETHGNNYIWNYKVIPKSPKKTLTKVFYN